MNKISEKILEFNDRGLSDKFKDWLRTCRYQISTRGIFQFVSDCVPRRKIYNRCIKCKRKFLTVLEPISNYVCDRCELQEASE